MKKQSGFTLIELMIAIIIVAILAAIGITTYSQAQKLARDSKRTEDVQAAQKAIETFKAATGSYPAAPADNKLDSISETGFNNYFQGNVVPKDTVSASYKYYLCDTSVNQNLRFAVCTQPLENCTGKCNDNAVTWTNTAACTFSYQASGTSFCVAN